MAGYKPLKIAGNSTGLVKYREDFLLPNDAYPTLENAFVWRERIKRKQGFELLGRLKRSFLGPTTLSLGNTVGAQVIYTYADIFASFIPPIGAGEVNKSIEPGSLVITIGAPDAATFTDDGLGGFTVTGVGVSAGSSINYATGAVTIVISASIGGAAITADISYFPGIPVMGLRSRELNSINSEQMVAFDQIYAYKFSSSGIAEEFLPGTVWTGGNSDFFWSTNYWIGDNNFKIFWVNNFVDPIRYTNGQSGTNWVDFTPQINAAGDTLLNALAILPFRGRLVVFNTIETDGEHPQRIRWAQIGNPFTIVSPIVSIVNPDAWRDDIRGKGGFLDIPTSENIITVGFVRDNLVIYCERSTWQLRYTGRSIAPFQIEKVNSELGVESTFSGVQFDTSLVGVGDKGIVECDSYKSERIDIKIVDLVLTDINNQNSGTRRVHGIRDFQQKLAFWIYPFVSANTIFPDRRLVYNYENDSWAIFTDSLTCLGTYQRLINRKWNTQPTISWQQANFPWINRASLFPSIMGGNQQGFVLFLDEQTTNQESLFIKNITGNTTTPTVIESPDHNMQTGQVIMITGIPAGSDFATSLNDQVFAISKVTDSDRDNFYIQKYDPLTGEFNEGQFDPPGTYIGGGQIRLRDNFRIVSKKFNYMDDGKQFQLGWVDVLFDESPDGAISLKVYNDYNENTASNIAPQNSSSDTFFNSVVPTNSNTGIVGGDKNWKRVFCATNSNFVTLEWTLNNEQMTNQCQESDVQIDAQVIWSRIGGRLGLTN